MSDLSHTKYSITDDLAAKRWQLLTSVARRFLPDGFWSGAADASDHVYLTFDDGPHPATTPWLLELLEQEDVKATFFLLGSRAAKHPQLIDQLAKQRHALGNHSFNHLYLPSLPTKLVENEIAGTNARIEEISGDAPVLFRPPFGVIDKRVSDCLKERAMKTVYWGAATEDWMPIGERKVVARLMPNVSAGTVIVLHEGKLLDKQTVGAAREIIRRCKAQGLSFKLLS